MNDDIPFPRTPYPQQVALMKEIYNCIDESKIGIFESPTGTGKSLSLICSSLFWQKRHMESILEAARPIKEQTNDGNIDWLLQFLDQDKIIQKPALSENKRLYYLRRLELIGKCSKSGRLSDSFQIHAKNSALSEIINVNDDEYLLPPYESDDESSRNRKRDSPIKVQYDSDSDLDDDSDDRELPDFSKIIYCSRTHSQLSQFAREMKNTSYSNTRCILLGSRKTFCINNNVNRLKSDARITEYCLEMQRKKEVQEDNGKRRRTKSTQIRCCEYKKSSKIRDFSNMCLSKVLDIEEIIQMGYELGACPYYGSRKAIEMAQVICVPYNMILQKEIRESLHLSLKENIVIFDEAHNLVDTINQVFSARIGQGQIFRSKSDLDTYLERFQSVIEGKNYYYLNLLASIFHKLLKFLEKTCIKRSANESVKEGTKTIMSVNDFLFSSRIDNINFLKVKKYLEASNFINRIGGFCDHQKFLRRLESHENVDENEDQSSVNDLRNILQFLMTLCNCDSDGRIMIESSEESENAIHFILLNAASQLRPILDECRSLVLLGGTMQPYDYLINSLFPREIHSRLTTFACDHIVAPKNVLALAVERGINGHKLDFRHEERFSPMMMRELKEIFSRVDKIVSKGIVVFFTSYSYMGYVVKQLSPLASVLSKPIFIESKSSSNTEGIFQSYSHAATLHGAWLFCVMGGKMSEGINFSDDLGRCVIVVGLPFPDSRDPILKERMKSCVGSDGGGNQGSNLLEALCMRQVNQSIGRSIRHINDFASILLLDYRYSEKRISDKLPRWIMRSYHSVESIESATIMLDHFHHEREKSR